MIAAALGLVEDDTSSESLTGMIQAMNRYLLERMSSEYEKIQPQSTLFEQVRRVKPGLVEDKNLVQAG